MESVVDFESSGDDVDEDDKDNSSDSDDDPDNELDKNDDDGLPPPSEGHSRVDGRTCMGKHNIKFNKQILN